MWANILSMAAQGLRTITLCYVYGYDDGGIYCTCLVYKGCLSYQEYVPMECWQPSLTWSGDMFMPTLLIVLYWSFIYILEEHGSVWIGLDSHRHILFVTRYKTLIYTTDWLCIAIIHDIQACESILHSYMKSLSNTDLKLLDHKTTCKFGSYFASCFLLITTG